MAKASPIVTATLATVGPLAPGANIAKKIEVVVKTKSGAAKSDLMTFCVGIATK